LILSLFFLFLIPDILADHLLIEPNGADTVAPCPEMETGEISLTTQQFSVDANRRLALEKANRIGHTELRRNAQTQMDMIRHRMAFHQLDTMLLTQLAQYHPDTAAKLTIQHAAPVLGHEHYVRLAVPSHMRLALPFSHGDLLSGERGGSVKGGHLHDFDSRRNGKASASLTATGGGLPHVSYSGGLGGGLMPCLRDSDPMIKST
jgi:hypothetical protein